jgi:hypothetical protein
MMGYSTAVVVTEPEYSRTSRQQTLVPILPADEFDAGHLDVEVRHARWLERSSGSPSGVWLAAALVATVFEADWIAGYFGQPVDALTLRRLDEALKQNFTV